MPNLHPYLNFNGTTEAAFLFYKSVFGGEFAAIMRFGDNPPNENFKIPEADLNKIMHVALPTGKGSVIMGTDLLESMGQKLIEGNNFSISISAESKEEADKFFFGLSDGGIVELPIGDSFWGSYFGMFQDKFGIKWLVDFDAKFNGQMNEI